MATDEIKQRLIYEAPNVGGGYNAASPARSLQPNQASYLNALRTVYGRLVPGNVASGGAALWTTSEAIIYSFILETDILKHLIMVGAKKVWSLSAGTTPIDRSPATPFSDVIDPMWQSTTCLHNDLPVAVLHNRVNVPHYFDGAAAPAVFMPLTNAPVMKTCIGFMGRLIGGGTYVSGSWHLNRLDWSVINNIADWSGISSGYLYLPNEGDPIQKLLHSKNNILMIFRQNSVYAGYVTTDSTNPLATELLFPKGIWAPNSLQMLGETGEFVGLGQDSVYRISPNGFTDVGTPIKKPLFNRADLGATQFAWSFCDVNSKEYYLVLKDKGSSAKTAWIYDWEEGTWSSQDFSGIEMIGAWYEV